MSPPQSPQLLVLGAGPAGASAAIAAAEHGVHTLLVDSAAAAGGQVYRAIPDAFRVRPKVDLGSDYQAGEALRHSLAESGAQTALGRTVWSVGSDLRVDAVGPNGPEHWCPDALVIASGTTERVVPFPGWTHPGVMGLAAATVLLKSQQCLPGRRTVVAGCGPLLAAVAYRIVSGGGEVAAVIDLASRRDWLHVAPALVRRPAELRHGFNWLRALSRAGVRTHHRYAVRAVERTSDGLRIHTALVDAEGAPISGTVERVFEADALTVGHGLVPATEVTRALGLPHRFERESGGWTPVLDADQRTARERVYAAGDGTGIRGAAAAALSGRIAGLSAARDLGRLDAARHRQLCGPIRRAYTRAAQLGGQMSRLMAMRPAQVRAISTQTIVCRCEDVTRADLDDAVERGCRDLGQLKSWTRCGMGPCQGRMCGDVVAELLAMRCGGRESVGTWTPRVPIRPVDFASLTGEFDYTDIPIPGPAPL